MKTNPDASISSYSVGDGSIEMGLTKREYFAAMAMQGVIIASQNSKFNGQQLAESVAKASVICADALIEELNKGGDK